MEPARHSEPPETAELELEIDQEIELAIVGPDPLGELDASSSREGDVDPARGEGPPSGDAPRSEETSLVALTGHKVAAPSGELARAQQRAKQRRAELERIVRARVDEQHPGLSRDPLGRGGLLHVPARCPATGDVLEQPEDFVLVSLDPARGFVPLNVELVGARIGAVFAQVDAGEASLELVEAVRGWRERQPDRLRGLAELEALRASR